MCRETWSLRSFIMPGKTGLQGRLWQSWEVPSEKAHSFPTLSQAHLCPPRYSLTASPSGFCDRAQHRCPQSTPELQNPLGSSNINDCFKKKIKEETYPSTVSFPPHCQEEKARFPGRCHQPKLSMNQPGKFHNPGSKQISKCSRPWEPQPGAPSRQLAWRGGRGTLPDAI